jgi:hypothetical protein
MQADADLEFGRVKCIKAAILNRCTTSPINDQRDTFLVRVPLDERDAHEKVENFRPSPGMPADVFIQTRERTFFTYLMQPVVDSFSRAFR